MLKQCIGIRIDVGVWFSIDKARWNSRISSQRQITSAYVYNPLKQSVRSQILVSECLVAMNAGTAMYIFSLIFPEVKGCLYTVVKIGWKEDLPVLCKLGKHAYKANNL